MTTLPSRSAADTGSAPGAGGRPVVVISWIPHHGRSAGLAEALDAGTTWSPWAKSGQPKVRTVLGWLRSGLQTMTTVARAPRGSVVVVMVPPVFALPVALVPAKLRGSRVVADIHSAAFNGQGWEWSHGLLAACLRRCQLVLVTNEEILAGVDLAGTPVRVAHDPIPVIDVTGTPPPLPPGPIVVFPASGASDEPVEAVAAAARLLEGEATIVVTGRRPGIEPGPGLHLPGFLPQDQFNALLARASVVLALTTRESTMQRAGYEALAVSRPVVCSDTRVLRSFFGGAAVYTSNEPSDMAAAVRAALARADDLVAEGRLVRRQQQEGLDDLVRALRSS